VSTSPSLSRPHKGQNAVAWVLQVLLAAVFLAAAGAKLASVPMLVQVFDQIGVGQWFRFVTAIVEIAGAIALLVPGFAALGALWLGATMFFATLTHVAILHTSAAPAMVLLVLTLILAGLRRDQLWALRDKVLGAK
jgi:uncharacterized membrane protein YphA (DoxX/SURF4 family)